ncbi:MAG: hypothetical protein KGZ87_05140 [Bacteroidetes bacterium]|nr:hypothetical protein [Bacteroidota bacterium]
MNIKITYLIIFLILLGCSNPEYRITKDGIKRDRPIKDGFDLIEIFVTEFNEEGKPTKYTDGISVFCGPTKGFSGHLGENVYNQTEKSLISKNRKKMDTIMALNGNSLGGEGHDKRIMEYIDSENLIDSIINENFPFEAQRKIRFFEKSENYKWVFTKDGVADLKFYDYSKSVFDTLPMDLKKNQWYLLNFSNASNIIDKVFFRIKENGEIEQFDYYKVIMGV